VACQPCVAGYDSPEFVAHLAYLLRLLLWLRVALGSLLCFLVSLRLDF
jgi:hypothetical protein